MHDVPVQRRRGRVEFAVRQQLKRFVPRRHEPRPSAQGRHERPELRRARRKVREEPARGFLGEELLTWTPAGYAGARNISFRSVLPVRESAQGAPEGEVR